MQLDQAVAINTREMDWEASPCPGVWRKPLARESEEQGHTTSIVKYDAGASFSAHQHPCGEEILVLDGVFSDEHGDYPAGTYLRNPPGSSHSPLSHQGCVLLVKLDQFDQLDNGSVRIDTNRTAWLPANDNLEIMLLHDFGFESVVMLKYPAGTRLRPHQHFGGEEYFVVSGAVFDEYGEYPKGTWVRSPHNSEHCPYVEQETIVWLKTGHLTPANRLS